MEGLGEGQHGLMCGATALVGAGDMEQTGRRIAACWLKSTQLQLPPLMTPELQENWEWHE
jgi:hypothetical protein